MFQVYDNLAGSHALINVVVSTGLRGQDGLRGRLLSLSLGFIDLDVRVRVSDLGPRHRRRGNQHALGLVDRITWFRTFALMVLWNEAIMEWIYGLIPAGRDAPGERVYILAMVSAIDSLFNFLFQGHRILLSHRLPPTHACM